MTYREILKKSMDKIETEGVATLPLPFPWFCQGIATIMVLSAKSFTDGEKQNVKEIIDILNPLSNNFVKSGTFSVHMSDFLSYLLDHEAEEFYKDGIVKWCDTDVLADIYNEFIRKQSGVD